MNVGDIVPVKNDPDVVTAIKLSRATPQYQAEPVLGLFYNSLGIA